MMFCDMVDALLYFIVTLTKKNAFFFVSSVNHHLR